MYYITYMNRIPKLTFEELYSVEANSKARQRILDDRVLYHFFCFIFGKGNSVVVILIRLVKNS